MFDLEKLNKIKKEIEAKFPEFKDIEPKIVKKKIAPQKAVYRKLSLGIPKATKTVFKLCFEKKIRTVDDVVIKQILIVTTNEAGQIIKITQSK